MSTTSMPLLFLSIYLSCFVIHVNSQLQLPQQEQTILLRLKQFWKNPQSLEQWRNPSNSSQHCAWPEVTCTNSSVTGLNLGEKNISGTIPPFISELRNLSSLNLSNNNIVGTFPVSVFNFSKLEFLDLSQNYFFGRIPDGIDALARVSELNLCCNNFTGDIPAAIGRLPELRYLQIFQNQFNGTFPPEMGNLSKLEFLRMSYNHFLPSNLPPSFTKLKKLKTLIISNANLIGEIPEMIGEMEALEWLDLSTNNLTGTIPNGLFMMKNLSVLYLYNNLITGEIPQVIEALNLTIVDLSNNKLTGQIPDDIGKLEKLTGLSLFFNQLSGEIPEAIGRLPALEDFSLFTNNLTGSLPPDLGYYSELKIFQVPYNKLTGELPKHLCKGGKLVGLIAFDNSLSGVLPESLGNCSSLEMVRLSNNNFSGNIPAGLWSASNLQYLMIGDNSFTGELPDEVSPTLSRLELNNNRFSGKIPFGVGSWRNLEVFSASNNQISGKIPEELASLSVLSSLMLDRNQLTGGLPTNISWKGLTTLDLSHNQLSGQIPREIAFLPVLTDLYLSDNQFSGEIPPEIGFLRLINLNLSSNNLTGKIPKGFENSAYVSSFLNNPGLCSLDSILHLNVCNAIASPSQESRKSSPYSLALVLSSVVAAVFVLALLLSLFLITVHRKRKHGLDSNWKLTSFQKLDFTESSILPGLIETNQIGSGGSGTVYKVAANDLGDYVAVKRIWNNMKLEQKLEKEFLAEVHILSTIRHLNIVKLLCCISNNRSKLLVYEYLKNRSLDQWLHTKKRSTTTVTSSVHPVPVILDWPKRLRIALGAAQGLSYMHHDCFPPIIHRDVKSSNILLDSDFSAKIADFGLAKRLVSEEVTTVSAVAGSFGYIAPEYARTVKVNEKTDVYSFGVVLLELATGKEANYGDEHTGLAQWSWRLWNEGRPIDDALAEEIKEPYYIEEMKSVFKLGLLCTNASPSARPSMKEAVNVLIQTSHPHAYGGKKVRAEYEATPLLRNSKREQARESDASRLASNV